MSKINDLQKSPVVSDEYSTVQLLDSELRGGYDKNYKYIKSVKTKHGNLIHIFNDGGKYDLGSGRSYFTVTHDNMPSGKPIAHLEVDHSGDSGEPQSKIAWTHPDHRGKGLNFDLHRIAIRHFGSMDSDTYLSSASHKLWMKLKKDPNISIDPGETVSRSHYYANPLDDLTSHNATYKKPKKEEDEDLLAASEDDFVLILEKGEGGDWKSEGYKISHTDLPDHIKQGGHKGLTILAHDKSGNKVGHAHLISKNKYLTSKQTEVDKAHQRKGLATEMYRYAERHTGKTMKPSKDRTDDGKALWRHGQKTWGHKNFGKSESDSVKVPFQNIIQSPDTIRLYRGLTKPFDSKFNLTQSDAPHGYSTWTDSEDLARQYSGQSGHIYYMDLPKSKMGNGPIDENPKSESYGDRYLFYFNDKPAGLGGVKGKEYLVYNFHDDYDHNKVFKKDGDFSKSSYMDSILIKHDWNADVGEKSPTHGVISPEGKFIPMHPNASHNDVLKLYSKRDEFDNPDHLNALDRGWIAVGHTGGANASVHKDILADRNHPALITLSKLMAKHYPDFELNVHEDAYRPGAKHTIKRIPTEHFEKYRTIPTEMQSFRVFKSEGYETSLVKSDYDEDGLGKVRFKDIKNEDDFLRYHYTGHIKSNAYEDMISHPVHNVWDRDYNQIDKYPILHTTIKSKSGKDIEIRSSGEPLKYVKIGDDRQIVRDSEGKATYLTPEEMKEKGVPTHDTARVAFHEGKPVAIASDEFGADGVWVHPEHQGDGIGVDMLHHFRQQFKPTRKIGQMTQGGVNMTRGYYRKYLKDQFEGKLDKSEGDLQKMSRPMLKVPYQKDISSRPDQEIYPMDMWSGKKVPTEQVLGLGPTETSLPQKRMEVSNKAFDPNQSGHRSKRMGAMIFNDLVEDNTTKGVYIASTKNPSGFAELGAGEHTFVHEGHHKLAHQLINKYGVDKAHQFFEDILSQVDPDVHSLANEVISQQPAYASYSRSSNKRHQLVHKEEVANLIRDILTNKDKRESFFSIAENLGHPFHLFDGKVKKSWQRMVDHAKTYDFNKVKDMKTDLAANEQDKVLEEKDLPKLSKLDQLKLGTEVEKEHGETVKKIIADVKAGIRKPIKEYFQNIAEDHLKEISDYYDRLCAMEEEAKVEKGELANAMKGAALAVALAQGTQLALKPADQAKEPSAQVRTVSSDLQDQKAQWKAETQKGIDEMFARNDREAFLGAISNHYKKHPDTERTALYGLHQSTVKDYIRNSPDHLKEYPYLLKYPGHILHDAVNSNPDLERDVAIWHHDNLKNKYKDQSHMAHAWVNGKRNTDLALKNDKSQINRVANKILK